MNINILANANFSKHSRKNINSHSFASRWDGIVRLLSYVFFCFVQTKNIYVLFLLQIHFCIDKLYLQTVNDANNCIPLEKKFTKINKNIEF